MAQSQQHNTPQSRQHHGENGVGMDSKDRYEIQTDEYREKYPWLDGMISPGEVIYDIQHPHIIIYMVQILSGIALIIAGIYTTINGIPQLEQYIQIDFSWYPLLVSLIGLFIVLFELYKRSRTFFVITSNKFLERRKIIAQRKNPIHWNRKANVNTFQTKTDVIINKFLPRSNIGHIKISTAEDSKSQLTYAGVKDMRKIEALIEKFMSVSSGGMAAGMYDDNGNQGGSGSHGRYPDQNRQNRQQNQQPQQNQFNRPTQQGSDYEYRNGGNGNHGQLDSGMGQQNQANQRREQMQNDSSESLFDNEEDEGSESRSLFDDIDSDDTLDDEVAERYEDSDSSSPEEPW